MTCCRPVPPTPLPPTGSRAGPERPPRCWPAPVAERSARSLRRAGAELGRRIAEGASAVTSVVAGETAAGIQAFAEGILLGGYRFDLKSGQQPPERPGQARLLTGPGVAGDSALARASVIAGAVAL